MVSATEVGVGGWIQVGYLLVHSKLTKGALIDITLHVIDFFALTDVT